jgi:hypothetical protein
VTFPPCTTWRLTRIPDWPNELDIRVVVDTTAPLVIAAIEQAAERQGLELERVLGPDDARGREQVAGDDPRFGEPVGENEVAGLAVAFKALVLRAGGRVEITEAELQEARARLARVDATPEIMTVEVIEGAPPDRPRFEAEPLTPADRDEFGHGLGEVDAGDEEPA